MNYSKYRFNLDMQSYISQISLPVRQYDTGIVLRINLTDGGVPYAIKDGCRAVFYARKADGNPLMNDCVIEKNTTICYEMTQQTTACSGVVDCEIRLYGTDGNLITTPRFILVVDSRVVHDEDFPLSESEQGIIDNLILSEYGRIEAEKEREKTHETMLDLTATIENKLASGAFVGAKGEQGDSGVYIGSEEPTDPSVKVWVNPSADAESSTLRIKDGQGNWIPIETIRGEPASTFFSYGTEDLKAGTTPLETGKLYFVHE